jgi:hypothetical protein
VGTGSLASRYYNSTSRVRVSLPPGIRATCSGIRRIRTLIICFITVKAPVGSSSNSGVNVGCDLRPKWQREIQLHVSPRALSSVADGFAGMLRGGMSKAAVFEDTRFGCVPIRYGCDCTLGRPPRRQKTG